MDYYQPDLALVHARGYGQHADNCAPGILALLASVAGGVVLELGCGSGALTRHLLAAGHRVIATDASPARALVAMAAALRPGGVLAIDVCDLEWGTLREGAENYGRVGPDYAVITEFSTPAPDKFVRDITTFVPDGAGAWRRGSEHHENVLVDTSRIPALLALNGVDGVVRSSFGTEDLPPGLRAVTGVSS
jgi:SAM-dependent methyltransferase